MPYQVTWDPGCYLEFDKILQSGIDIGRMKHAILVVEKELSHEPQVKGIGLSEGLRRLEILSVRAYFHIEEPNRVVIDSILWTNRRKPT